MLLMFLFVCFLLLLLLLQLILFSEQVSTGWEYQKFLIYLPNRNLTILTIQKQYNCVLKVLKFNFKKNA